MNDHAPKLAFAKNGPAVIGFARTELDSDEVASRKNQTDLIRQYASQHGMCEPYVLPTAARADLKRLASKGSIIVTTRLQNLLRRPSDVESLLTWIVANDMRIHVLDLGGDITDKLGAIRQVSACYAHLEGEIEKMRRAEGETEAHHEAVLSEAVSRVVHTLTGKFLGLRSEVDEIKSAAKAAVIDPVLRARRAQAAKLIADMPREDFRAAVARANDAPWEAQVPQRFPTVRE